MASKKNKDKNTTKKYQAEQKEKLVSGGLFLGFKKGETALFFVGLFLVLVSIFMIVSFVSYLFTGESDYSLLEQGLDPFNEQLRYKNVCGSWGALLSFFFLNDMFGLASFVIPVYLSILGMRLMKIFKFTLVRKFILFSLFMIWTSVFLATFSHIFPVFDTSFLKIGGNHGINVVNYLTRIVGVPGLLGILALYAIAYLIYLSAKTIEVIRNMMRFRFLQKVNPSRLNLFVRRNKDDDSNVINDDNDNGDEGDNNDENENALSASATSDSDQLGIPSSDTDSLLSSDPDGQGRGVALDSDETKSPVLFFDDITLNATDTEAETSSLRQPDDVEGTSQSFNSDSTSSSSSTPSAAEASQASAGGMDIEVKETDMGDGEIMRGDINTPYDPKLDLELYKYPTLDLLADMKDEGPKIDMIEQKANQERITHVLHNFGVEISSIKATIGPTITLYEIVPAEGTRISKIRNLEDDIALSLAAEGIRIIAPIPGKGTIGIEVPNKKKCIVSMESIINSRVYQESTMELPCAVGKTISNEVFMFDLAKAPHLLVAGATGQGKSVGLNAIVTSLLYKKHPSEMKIVMVDPKKVEFSIYSPIENHFLARLEEEEDCIITDVQKVVKTLNSLCVLMDTRYDLLKKANVRNIKEYNEKFKNRRLNPEHGHEYMPYIVVIVDEFGDLIMTAGKEVELPICRIAQLARAVGIHMIIATQRPQASIISGAIKTNFPTRIAFKVSSMMDSRVILDRSGANQLIGKGDMLYLQGGEPVRVQCAFVDTPEVNNICSFIAKQQSFLHPMFLPEVVDPEGDGGMGMGTVDRGHLDPMFAEVAQFVVSNQSGSTSMIQRNFSIGYNRAGKIMDQLEKMGVVGTQVGSKPREVLIKDSLTLDSLLNTL